MVEAGHEFRVSANNVWLTAAVPLDFLHRLQI
jgi:RNA:NAD 2'-phosphotransferase (TPT1/KptA family)